MIRALAGVSTVVQELIKKNQTLLIHSTLTKLSPNSIFKGYNQPAALLTGILGIVFIIWLGFYTASSISQISGFLDSPMKEFGFISNSYMIFGRIYKGTIRGKNVEINFIPSTGLRPALLNIYIEANIGTRLAIGEKRPLLDCNDCSIIEDYDEVLGENKVYALEREKANIILDNHKIRSYIFSIMENQASYRLREIYFQPDKVWLRIHPRQMNGEIFRKLIEDSILLTIEAEKIL